MMATVVGTTVWGRLAGREDATDESPALFSLTPTLVAVLASIGPNALRFDYSGIERDGPAGPYQCRIEIAHMAQPVGEIAVEVGGIGIEDGGTGQESAKPGRDAGFRKGGEQG